MACYRVLLEYLRSTSCLKPMPRVIDEPYEYTFQRRTKRSTTRYLPPRKRLTPGKHPVWRCRERGLNENTKGLIRQYFPKHRDLTTVTQQEIKHAMDKLNHRPRKSLGFRTPHEVFFNTRTSLTVALQN
jgi:hypothetical protein